MSKKVCVVIGGGVIGASSAYYLTHSSHLGPDDEIYLIEEIELGAGASGKSGGFLALDWHGSTTASLAECSYNLHRELAASHDGANQWGYRTVDTLSITAKMATRHPQNKNVKLPKDLTWLNPENLTEAKDIGNTHTTAQVHPKLLTRKLAELSQLKGLKMVIGKATEIVYDETSHKPKSVTVRKSTGEEIEIDCNIVLIAAGPWSTRVAESLTGGQAKPVQISAHHANSILITTPKPLTPHVLFCSTSLNRNFLEPEIFPRPDGTCYICGQGSDFPLSDSAFEVRHDPKVTGELKRVAEWLAPNHLSEEAGAQIQAEQACFVPNSPSTGSPILGELCKNVYIASGHSVWGICLGPGTGLVMAQMILEGKVTCADISSLTP